jgi:class 3 adenylate cyclase
MPAWVEDAQQLTELRDLDSSHNSVLLRTAEVEEFLSNLNLSSHALVAPKGFGKTFVLKLKRISLQENDYRCFPYSPIVDRPSNKPPILPNEIINVLENSDNWETLWNIAFSICLIKGFQDDPDVHRQLTRLLVSDELPSTLVTILTHPHITRPFDILHDCLAAQRNEIFLIMRAAQHVTRIFATIHKQAGIFVDNIDEYLIHYINFSYLRRSDVHERFVRIWHAGQVGAWLALRRLHGINPHVRIFVSIRKEAYQHAAQHEPQFSNLRSFRRELRYRMEDIKQIIENNIMVVPKNDLVDRTNPDPLLRFLGPKNEFLSNTGTTRQERAMDYWIRHCSLRPRDAVVIGKEISLIGVKRRNQQEIRIAINSASAERVETLFNEVAPFFSALYPDVFPQVIKSNVLTHEEIEEASRAYAEIASMQYDVESEAAQHPFSALYALGLIGTVQQSRDNPGKLVQKFAAVGEIAFGRINVLPRADTYLIHPSLSDFIIRRNVVFLKELNKHNVIGDELEWRLEESIRFVAVGDIRGYRESVVQNTGKSQTFDKFWRELFRQFTGDLDYASMSSGDHITLADRSAARLLRAAAGLAAQLNASGYNLQIRFGAHSGYWRLNPDLDGVRHPEISDVVSVAARIEPLAKPGDILLSQQFVDDARRYGYGFDGELPSLADDAYFAAGRYQAGVGVLISKEREADQRIQIYLLRKSAEAKPGSED